MITHAEPKASPSSSSHAAPVPNTLVRHAQPRSALLRAGVQLRLKTGAVNDPLEREANAAAGRVMRMPEPPPPIPARGKWAGGMGNLIQAKASPASTTAEVPTQLESSLSLLRHGGTPLDASSRSFFEPRFGQDFSQVRLYTDASAAQMADALSAKAFTLGNDISFAAGQYSANTSTGKNLLAHELAHVLQQRGLNGGTAQTRTASPPPKWNQPTSSAYPAGLDVARMLVQRQETGQPVTDSPPEKNMCVPELPICQAPPSPEETANVSRSVPAMLVTRVGEQTGLQAKIGSEQAGSAADQGKERTKRGTLNLITGLLIVVGGVVCIVASGGLATPLVVGGTVVLSAGTVATVATLTGGATVVFGLSNMSEAGEDIYFGMKNNTTVRASNPVRDNIFMGDQRTYDTVGQVFVVSSTFFSLGSSLATTLAAADTAGSSMLRAASVYSGKTIGTVAAGHYGALGGEYAARKWGGADETTARIFGEIAGFGAGLVGGWSLELSDQRNDWSRIFRAQKITNPGYFDSSGKAKWPGQDGFAVGVYGKGVKYRLVPKKGDLLDRFGSFLGRFFSPLDEYGRPYSYYSRSLPYDYNEYAYHLFKVTRNFDELPIAIKGLPPGKLKDDVTAYLKAYYRGSANGLTTYEGPIASAFGTVDTNGIQIYTPLPADLLIRLEFIEEVTPVSIGTSGVTSVATGVGAGRSDSITISPDDTRLYGRGDQTTGDSGVAQTPVRVVPVQILYCL